MVEATGIPDIEMEVSESSYTKKVKAAYPTTKEELVNFINCCKLKGLEVMLYPRCNARFDKNAIESLKKTKPQMSRGGKWPRHRPNYDFNKTGFPYRTYNVGPNHNGGLPMTFTPQLKAPVGKWMHPMTKKTPTKIREMCWL